jgi:competence protein ComEC
MAARGRLQFILMKADSEQTQATGHSRVDGSRGEKDARHRASRFRLLAGSWVYEHLTVAGLGAYLAVYALASLSSSWAGGAALMLLVVGGLAFGWWVRLPRTALFVVAALSVTGIASAWSRPRPLPPHHLVRHLPNGAATLEGWVENEPVGRGRTLRVRLGAEWLGAGRDRRPVTGDCLLDLPSKYALSYGQRVRLAGLLLSRPDGYANPGGFDYRVFLARRGIYVVGRLQAGGRVEVLPGLHPKVSSIKGRISRWRGRMLGAVERRLPGEAGAVLQAIVLGARERLSPDVRKQFHRTGTAHLLAISGLHVGFVAVAAFWALRALLRGALRLTPEAYGFRLAPSRWAAAGTAPAVLFYALLVGGRVATIRASIMILVYLAARLCRKRRNGFHALALAAILILGWDPQVMGDVSFQLSFAAVTAILLVLRAAEGLENDPLPTGETTVLQRLARRIGMIMLISLVASLATWPLIARSFHRVSLVGPLANALVVPLASLTIPLGLVAALCSLIFPAGAQILLAPAGWGSSSLLMILRAIARIPYASLVVTAPPGPAIIAYYALLACLLAWPRARRRGIVALAAGMVIIGTTAAAAVQHHRVAGRLAVIALDAGRAQAIILRLPDERTLLWYGAPPGASSFVARRVVAKALLDQRIGRLNGLIAANATRATASGVVLLAKTIEIEELWVAPSVDGTWPAPLRRTIEELALPVRELRAGWSKKCGAGCLLRVLWPRPGSPPPPKRVAADGPLLRVQFNRTSALLTGDISYRVERGMLEEPEALKADLLQVPKAASRFASTDPFLDAVGPSVAVLAARPPASWGEDVERTLDRYRKRGIRLWRVGRDGAITWESDGWRSVVRTVRFNAGASRRRRPGAD